MKVVGGHNIEQTGRGHSASIKTVIEHSNPFKNIWIKILVGVVIIVVGAWALTVFGPNRQSSDTDSVANTQTEEQDMTLRATFTPPSGWAVFDTYPNGITYKSPDFQSEQNFRGISSGSTLTVANTGKAIWTLQQMPEMTTDYNNGNTVTDIKYIKVDGYDAVTYFHSYGENNNSHTVVDIIRDGVNYRVEQQYEIGATNPYPNLIDGILTSFQFSK
jgi:hypothetical protein